MDARCAGEGMMVQRHLAERDVELVLARMEGDGMMVMAMRGGDTVAYGR